MGMETSSLVLESLKALNESVQDTLETLAYAEAEPLAEGVGLRLDAPFYRTTVAVNAPYSGTIALITGSDLARSLIGSMLGCPEKMQEEWIQDGLSELVNIIGGRIMAHLMDSCRSFDLGIPQTVFVEETGKETADVMVRQAYAVNDGFIVVELAFRKLQAA